MTEVLEDALARLEFHLDVQDSFWFALAVSNDARTRALLRERAEAAVAVEVLSQRSHGPVELIQRICTPTEVLRWLVLDGRPDMWEEDATRVLLALNERRELLRGFDAGLVIEGRERLKALVRNVAPDLFSIRACIFETGTVEGPPPRVEEQPSELDAHNHSVIGAALQRAQRLEGNGELTARRSRLAALAKAAEGLISQGWFTDASNTVQSLRTEAYQLAATQFSDPWSLSYTALSESLTGSVARARGDLPAATSAFRAAVWMRELLSSDGDTESRRQLARALAQLGEVHLAQGLLERAEAALVKAVGVGEGLVSANPDRLELASQLAMTLSILGDVYLQKIDRGAARDALERALSIRQDLAGTGSDRYRRYLGIAWGRIGALCEAEGDLDHALLARRRAAEIAEELAMKHRDNASWDMEYASTLGRVGDILLARGDLTEATEVLHHALARAQTVAEEDPANARWRGELASALLRAAGAEKALGDPIEAADLTEAALELLGALVGSDPTNRRWKREHASARVFYEGLL